LTTATPPVIATTIDKAPQTILAGSRRSRKTAASRPALAAISSTVSSRESGPSIIAPVWVGGHERQRPAIAVTSPGHG
jgi:hypothetical protein